MTPELCTIAAGDLDEETKLPRVRAYSQLTDVDQEEFGDIDAMQCLGITAKPFPANDDGAAEGVVLRNVGNTDGVLVGGRDSRCSKVYGALGDGDTVLHSTDPAASAQVQTKANRQTVLITKDTHGDTMTIALDGKNDKVQIAAFGGIIEMTPDGITLAEPSGKAFISISGGSVILSGKVILGGSTPTFPILSGPGGVGPACTAVPCPGVFCAAPAP